MIFNNSYSRFFQVFNRDEPDREKLVHVTVKASDKGRPQLEDVCTLAVKIKDKNDNAPVFDRANYDIPIAQVRIEIEAVPRFPVSPSGNSFLFLPSQDSRERENARPHFFNIQQL